MSRRFAILSAVLAGLLTIIVHSASAQNAARAIIPFAFAANQQQLPAGCYQVKLEWRGILSLKNCDTGNTVELMVRSGEADQSVGHSSLVFYAGERGYRLTNVRFTYTNTDSVLSVQPKHNREMTMNKERKTIEIAMN